MNYASKIPTELIVIILSYINDEYSTRKGELIKIIKKKDERYNFLEKNIRLHIQYDFGESCFMIIKDIHNSLIGIYNILGTKNGLQISISKYNEDGAVLYRNFCGLKDCGTNCHSNGYLYYNTKYIEEKIKHDI